MTSSLVKYHISISHEAILNKQSSDRDQYLPRDSSYSLLKSAAPTKRVGIDTPNISIINNTPK